MKLFSIISAVALASIATVSARSAVKARASPDDTQAISQDNMASYQDLTSSTASMIPTVGNPSTATIPSTAHGHPTYNVAFTIEEEPTSRNDSDTIATSDRQARGPRSIIFHTYTGDVCWGPSFLWFPSDCGNFGDPKVENCIPFPDAIPDDITRFQVEAEGCITAMVMGDVCDVPIGFNTGMQTNTCFSDEILGQTNEHLWYRCDG